ncbi:MAG: hypothetical protein JWO55_144 [Candidatus Saccharibacteria bacterium]|jgi:hypothetical protein|nr:hypothetical protein [Candidatus Saccharibacteria bacterium]
MAFTLVGSSGPPTASEVALNSLTNNQVLGYTLR